MKRRFNSKAFAITVLICFSIITSCFSVFADTSDKICGDVNRDGKVDIADVTQIQKYICEIEYPEDDYGFYADVNRDNLVNIKDATVVQRYIVGLIRVLPDIENAEPETTVTVVTQPPATVPQSTAFDGNIMDTKGWNNRVIKP